MELFDLVIVAIVFYMYSHTNIEGDSDTCAWYYMLEIMSMGLCKKDVTPVL